MIHLCPSCGHNLTNDTPLDLGDWKLAPNEVWHKGEALRLTAAESGVLYAIAKGEGRAIKAEAIGNRVSDSEDPVGITRVWICRLRRKLAGFVPFEMVRGCGYRWSAL